MIWRVFLVVLLLMSTVSAFGEVTWKSTANMTTQEKIEYAEDLYRSFPDSSLAIMNLAEQEAMAAGDEELRAFAMVGQARILIIHSDLDKASALLDFASDVFRKFDNKQGIADSYTLLAILSGRIKKKKDEIDYLLKAKELYASVHDSDGVRKCLVNLGYNYSHFGELDKAELALLEMEDYRDGARPTDECYLNQNWGFLYRTKGELDKSLGYFISALSVANKLSMLDSEASLNCEIGRTLTMLGRYDAAKDYLEASIAICEEHEFVMELMEVYQALKDHSMSKGDMDQAFRYLNKEVSIRDTLYSIDKVNRLNDYERKLALAEKEKVIAETQLDAQLSHQEAEEATSRNRWLMIIATLVTIVAVLALYFFVKARRLKLEIEEQKAVVDGKNEQLSEAYTHITDSINYANRIQQALLTGEENRTTRLIDYFVFFKPKDVVSGDFYWIHETDECMYIAAADCTGHGVPGAFMSMLGMAFLKEIVSASPNIHPATLLGELRERVMVELDQKEGMDSIRDGMDISLVRKEKDSMIVEWAGANNPLWVIKKGSDELTEIRGNKQPVSYYDYMTDFTKHEIVLSEGDTIYMFSDGYADQFGGPKGKKFKYKPFKNLLLEVSSLSMKEQKEQVERTFLDWKGEFVQVDDICVIGIRI